MRKSKTLFFLLNGLFFWFVLEASSSVTYAQDTTSSYIMVDIGSSQRQTLYIYNQGRLETEILPDKSIVQYAYDSNGNLLKRSKGTSSEPYIFSTSALSYDIFLKGVEASTQQVYFPTWTEQGGQDDVEWIAGEKLTTGV